MDEAETREQLIDHKLKAAGWGIMRFQDAFPITECASCTVTEYPTANGPAEYALCVDGQTIGTVEAKRLHLARREGSVIAPGPALKCRGKSLRRFAGADATITCPFVAWGCEE